MATSSPAEQARRKVRERALPLATAATAVRRPQQGPAREAA